MAGSVNKVILVGNLGADPDIRRTQDGRPICNLSVATSESWKDRNTGERRKKPNGTAWSSLMKASAASQKTICAKGPRSILKDSCRPASGRIRTGKIATQPKWFCRASMAT